MVWKVRSGVARLESTMTDIRSLYASEESA